MDKHTANRNKTPFRHIDANGNKFRVTELNGQYFIADTNERAEGKMVHRMQLNYNNGKLPSKRKRHYHEPQDEWGDYAFTASDL